MKFLQYSIIFLSALLSRMFFGYIFYGSSERAEYGSAGEDKFAESLEPVCDQGDSVFYRVTDVALQVAAS